MRLWTIHPRYLDRQGLLGLWRESLLAQKVLAGKTKGYTRHPQLQRFRQHRRPLEAIGYYLEKIREEAVRRGYRFDRNRILLPVRRAARIRTTLGQVGFETRHLGKKLKRRDRKRYGQFPKIAKPGLHPLFVAVKGGVEPWEKTS